MKITTIIYRSLTATLAALCLIPATALAEPTGTALHNSDIDKTTGKILESGSYYLAEDITAYSTTNLYTFLIEEGSTVSLDLNGHTLKSKKQGQYSIITVMGKLTLTGIEGSVIDGGSQKYGRAGRGIRIEGKGDVTIDGSILMQNCKVSTMGGAICALDSTTALTVKYVEISGCSAANTGGAIHSASNSCVIDKAYIHDCELSGASSIGECSVIGGGAISNCGVMTINDVTISDCTMSYTGNSSSTGGGGVLNFRKYDKTADYSNPLKGSRGILNIYKCNITACKATGTNLSGGGILNTCGGRIRLEGEKNEDILITDCEAYYYGGGMSCSSHSTQPRTSFYISRCKISGNKSAHYAGGGISFSYADGELLKGLIDGNTARLIGGGINSGNGSTVIFGREGDPDDDLVVSNNKVTSAGADDESDDGGGGLSVGRARGDNTFTIYSGKFIGNSVVGSKIPGKGGGIYVRDPQKSSGNSALIIYGGVISGNTAGGGDGKGYGGNGGGIYINGSATMTGGTIEGNVAYKSSSKTQGSGGGIFMGAEGATFAMSGGEITCNKCYGNGAGVYVTGKASTDVVTITGGSICRDTTSNGYAGALYVANGNVSLSNTTLSENSSVKGGAIYIANGDLTVDAGMKMSGNSATHGGGIYSAKGKIEINGGSISLNTGELGAGIYLGGSGDITMSNGEIRENYATDKGGGVYTLGDFILTGGTIASNNSSSDGAGIYVSNGTTTISGGTVSGNYATTGNGGAFYVGGGTKTTTTISGGTISGNYATTGNGGGFYAEGTLNFDGGTVTQNTAPKKNGGGFYINGGTVTFGSSTSATTYGTVSNNTANNGGGVYITGDGSTLTINMAVITENRAVTPLDGNKLTTAYQLDGDTANGIGGGIYVGSGTSSSKATLVHSCKKIAVYLNTADQGADDIFANALYTSVTLPSASSKSLVGSSKISAGWYSDYISGDTKWSETPFSGQTQKGRFSILADRTGWPCYTATSASTQYLCLALGTNQCSITITKSGLNPGESAIFTVSHSGSVVRRVVITGDGTVDAQTVKVSNLEPGQYTVSELTGWSWTYDVTSSGGTSGTAGAQTIDNLQGAQALTFSNTAKSGTDQPVHGEAAIENTFSN